MPSRYCTQCGAEVAADDKFCTVCGAAVDQTTPAATVVPTGTPSVPATPTAQPRSKLPVIALSLLGVLVVAAVAFGVYRATIDTAPSAEEIVAMQAAEGLPYPEVIRVTAAEAKALFDADAAIFVDVRDPESYAAAHVPGAVALPLNELETGHGQLPQNAEIITYCT